MLKHTANLLSIGSCILVIFFSILLLIPEKKNQRYPPAKVNTVQKITKPKGTAPKIIKITLPAPPRYIETKGSSEPKQAVNHPSRSHRSKQKKALTHRIMTPRNIGTHPKNESFTPLKPKPPKRAINTKRRAIKNLQKSRRPTQIQKLKIFKTKTSKIIPKPDPVETIPRGRVLLRLLEHGKGPIIDIAWPENYIERQRLFKAFRTCYGMKLAVITNDRKLFTQFTPPTIAWRPNSDAYSGFLRSPIGQKINNETRLITEITRRHGIQNGRSVRIFPRNTDAIILAGFQRIVGKGYTKYSRIQAHYRLTPKGGVYLEQIKVDERPVPGTIRIPPEHNSGCRV